MPVKSGSEYIARLNLHTPEVWIQGDRIEGEISAHPAFGGLMNTQAGLYDMQLQGDLNKTMTYVSPLTQDPVGLSFLQPKTKKDLTLRRTMMQTWAYGHHGFLGRAPDYMNTAIMSFGAAAGLLEKETPEYASNLRHYYEYCRENDITLSHVFIQPKSARVATFFKTLEDTTAAKIIDKNKDGIVISGSFFMDTQGATSDEILVFPQPFPMMEEKDNPYAFACAVPSNLPGIRFICRESLVGGDSTYNYPLSSRYEEMDTLVLFEEVLVPWDRVFICGDETMIFRLFNESQFYIHSGVQIMCKNIAKIEFILGMLEAMIEAAGIEDQDAVIEKLSEVIVALETLRSMQLAAEHTATKDRWGIMVPNRRPLLAANVYFPKIYPRMIEIIQLLGASGLIMIPDEQTFATGNGPLLDHYLKGIGISAKDNVQLSRLAFELSVSAFGGRQTVYERFFFGDPTTVSKRLYHSYSDRAGYKERVKKFLT